MTTLAHQLTKSFAIQWDQALPTAVFAGIVGDAAHMARGGYHVSIEDQPDPNNYSVTRADDKAPPGTWPRNLASAVDMSMSRNDMVATYWRVKAVWENPNDPRRKYLNAVNVFDGIADAERLDFVTGSRGYASPDHKTHTHLEIRRRYTTDPAAYDAAFSMVSGETLAGYLARHGTIPTKPPAGTQPGTRTLRNTGKPSTYMNGDDVKYVQTFIGPPAMGNDTEPDGYYGPQTESGVRWYQKMRGIQQDGVVGPDTWHNILGRPVSY